MTARLRLHLRTWTLESDAFFFPTSVDAGGIGHFVSLSNHKNDYQQVAEYV